MCHKLTMVGTFAHTVSGPVTAVSIAGSASKGMFTYRQPNVLFPKPFSDLIPPYALSVSHSIHTGSYYTRTGNQPLASVTCHHTTTSTSGATFLYSVKVMDCKRKSNFEVLPLKTRLKFKCLDDIKQHVLEEF